jgi:aspartyl-tRNA synthetase
MLSDMHKYFQVAKCFRDEASRGDRQPEFTQVDLEMAFVSEDQVMEFVSNLLYTTVKTVYPKKELMHPD